jgi:hypothetical protein
MQRPNGQSSIVGVGYSPMKRSLLDAETAQALRTKK